MKKLLNFTAIILSLCLLVGSTVIAADTETYNSIESKKLLLKKKEWILLFWIRFLKMK